MRNGLPPEAISRVALGRDGSLVPLGRDGQELGRVPKGPAMQVAMDGIVDPKNGQRVLVHTLPSGQLAIMVQTNPTDDKGRLIDMGRWWDTGEADGEVLHELVKFARSLG